MALVIDPVPDPAELMTGTDLFILVGLFVELLKSFRLMLPEYSSSVLFEGDQECPSPAK